jgi:His/Glu/Gln/Arg/opine family amino acid ABC transporter permease subunit
MSFKDLLFVLQGLKYTFSLVLLSVLFGFFIGIETARIRTYKTSVLRYIIILYSSVFRGTPLLLQMVVLNIFLPFLCQYAITFVSRFIYKLNNINVSYFFTPFVISAIVLILNSGAYFHEIFMTLFNSIPPIQKKLATSLGLTDDQYVEHIVKPQIIINSSNQFIVEVTTLVKETALFSQIGLSEIYFRSNYLLHKSYNVEFFFLSGIIYYICSIFFELTLKYLLNKKITHKN